MTAAYYDTTYLFKLQCLEQGSAEVRAHAAKVDVICCSLHGRAEFVSAGHRKVREGAATLADLGALVAQIQADSEIGALFWYPVSEASISVLESVYRRAPSDCYLRAADGLHLACAYLEGFSEIYTNDRHLLEAAPLFGLKGVNLIR